MEISKTQLFVKSNRNNEAVKMACWYLVEDATNDKIVVNYHIVTTFVDNGDTVSSDNNVAVIFI
jgi:hypothetical protein